jgi:hypothetical protein
VSSVDLARIPRLGISNQPAAAAVAIGQILGRLYPHLGYDSLLLCRYYELLWSDCNSLLLGSVRGRSNTRIRAANLTGMRQTFHGSILLLNVLSGIPEMSKASA